MANAGDVTLDVVVSCRDRALELPSLFSGDGREFRIGVPLGCGTGSLAATRPARGVGIVSLDVDQLTGPCFWRVLTTGQHFSLVYHICDSGSFVTSDDGALRFTVESGTSTFGYSPAPVEIRPVRGTRLKAVYLAVAPELFESFWDNPANPIVAAALEVTNRPERPVVHHGAVTPSMALSIAQLLECPYEGALKQIYLEGKCLELLAQHLFSAAQSGGTGRGKGATGAKLSPREVEQLREARECLIANMQTPPTLAELSRHVGLNVKKLKLGFRELFGSTVFATLRSLRLGRARQLLADCDCNVSEACFGCGYTSLSHFSAAFRREFGVAPHTYRKQCRGEQLGEYIPI